MQRHTCPPTRQAEALSRKRGVPIPADMLAVAGQYGLRAAALERFFALLSERRGHAEEFPEGGHGL